MSKSRQRLIKNINLNKSVKEVPGRMRPCCLEPDIKSLN